MDGLDKGCYSILRTRSQNRLGKPSRDVASDILIRQVPARLSERQCSTSEPFKPQQAQLPPEGITNKFATGPTGLLREPVKKLSQVGVQPDGDGRSHVVQSTTHFHPTAMCTVHLRARLEGDGCGEGQVR